MKANRVMRVLSLATCSLSLLVNGLPTSFSATEGQVQPSRSSFLSKINQTKTGQRLERENQSRIQKLRSFVRSYELLKTEGVPFDPNELLEPGWRESLALKIAQIPQM